MDVMTYIVIGVALVFGLLTGIFISPKRRIKKAGSDEHSSESEQCNSTEDLEKRIETLQAKCDELKQVADAKTAELASLQEQAISGFDSADKDLLLKIKTENEETVNKLKKQLDDSEEELEDAESTVKKLKRQLEEKVAENGQLIDDLSMSRRSINDLTSSLEATKTEIEATSLKLDSVSGSLSFVQDVLTAKPVNTENLTKQDKKITALYDFVYSDLQELYKRHFRPNEKSGYVFGQGLSQWKAVKRKSWIEGKKTIAFIGEFSAGKTSIVNRILSQDDPNVTLLPVSAKATTAIPTYIAGGDIPTYQFYSPDGSLKGISEDTFKKVSKEILGNIEGVSELISYFVMTYKNPHLAGMSILDTPGFSSGDKEDAVRTVDVINECDALFWVFDVNAGTVNRSSIEVIKTNMTRPLFVIINKTDTKAPSEVDAVEHLIKKAFDDEGIKVEGYLRFSSKSPLDELMGVIAAIENDSSAEEYLSLLTNDFLPALIDTCEEDYKTAAREYDSSNKKCNKKWESIIKLCQTVQKDSIDAANIPHWETHWLRKDRYEMDEQEGGQLIDLLNKVANEDIVRLYEEIGQFGELMQENQIAYEKKNEVNHTLRRFRDYQSKLNRLVTDLNR